MKANRILLVCLGIIVILNAIFLFSCPRGLHHLPPHPPKLSVALGMTGKNARWVDQEFNRHIQVKHQLLDQQKSLRKKVSISATHSTKNQQLFEKISRIQYQIDSCTFNHFIRVNEKCNPQEKKALKRVIRRMIEMAGKPMPTKKR